MKEKNNEFHKLSQTEALFAQCVAELVEPQWNTRCAPSKGPPTVCSSLTIRSSSVEPTMCSWDFNNDSRTTESNIQTLYKSLRINRKSRQIWWLEQCVSQNVFILCIYIFQHFPAHAHTRTHNTVWFHKIALFELSKTRIRLIDWLPTRSRNICWRRKEETHNWNKLKHHLPERLGIQFWLELIEDESAAVQNVSPPPPPFALNWHNNNSSSIFRYERWIFCGSNSHSKTKKQANNCMPNARYAKLKTVYSIRFEKTTTENGMVFGFTGWNFNAWNYSFRSVEAAHRSHSPARPVLCVCVRLFEMWCFPSTQRRKNE